MRSHFLSLAIDFLIKLLQGSSIVALNIGGIEEDMSVPYEH
ncbi:MAG: hypothetical protein V7L01_32905 [Nostoc sp.]